MKHFTALALISIIFATTSVAAQCDPQEIAKIIAEDGIENNDFGWSVAIDGDIAVVGDYGQIDGRGAAYVFRRSESAWVQEQQLLHPVGASEDFFGYAVAVSGDTIVVGVPLDDDLDLNCGAAYVYKWNGTNWGEQEKLLPSDGGEAYLFGISVSLQGDTALIGASNQAAGSKGAAYVFRRSGGDWDEQQILLASDGAPGDSFGCAVCLSDDRGIVGADSNGEQATQGGAAYVFRLDGSSWEEEQKLLAADGNVLHLFGTSVAISGDVAVVGAPRDDDAGTDSGSAYVFHLDGNVWAEEQELHAGLEDARFGHCVAVNGDHLLVGFEYAEQVGLFTRSGFIWNEEDILTASDGESGDAFGSAVAIDGNIALIGAYRGDGNANGSGAGYLFDLDCDPGAPARVASFIVQAGTHVSGNTAKLRESDNAFLKIDAAFIDGGNPPYQMIVEVKLKTQVVDPTSLHILVEGKLSQNGGTARLYLRNWAQGGWTLISSEAIGKTEMTQSKAGLNASKYINASGVIKLRIKHTKTTSSNGDPFRSLIDHIQALVR